MINYANHVTALTSLESGLTTEGTTMTLEQVPTGKYFSPVNSTSNHYYYYKGIKKLGKYKKGKLVNCYSISIPKKGPYKLCDCFGNPEELPLFEL